MATKFKINTSPNRGCARPSASKDVAYAIVEGDTNDTALSNPAVATTEPTTNAIHTTDRPVLRLIFGGTTTADQTINYQAIGWTPFLVAGNTNWIPMILAKGLVTLGATAVPSGIAANCLFADTITDTFNKPGSSVRSPGDDSVATLDLDVRNCPIVTIETDRATGAASAYAWGVLGEQISNISAT